MSGASASLLPLAVAAPICGAIAAPLLGRLWTRLTIAVSMLALVVSCALLALLAPQVYDGEVLVEHVGNWHPVDGSQLGVTFAADPFGLTFALLATAIGAVLLLLTISELGDLGGKEMGGYACLFQLLVAALVASALTADVLDLFVWFEVAALASYGLTGFFLERPPALEAAFKTMVLTNMAAFFVFVAVAVVYAGHGALNYGQVYASMAAAPRTADLVALALVVGGFGTKAGLVPFHGWLADAHTAAPGPVSALFSGLLVTLGLLGIARFVFDVQEPNRGNVLGLLAVVGGVSALVGAAMALVQDDLKRLLAYDTVSQMGVLTVALSVGSPESLVGMTYHLVNHALFKTLLFVCAGAIVHATGMTRLSEMGGLARHRPLVTVAFVVGAAAIAGVPPLNGYVSLGLVHHALEGAHPVELFVLTLAQALTVAALARATYLAFFRRRDDDYDRIERPGAGMLVAFGLLAGACVVFGALPTLVLDHVVRPAAGSLVHGAEYARATLADGGRVTPAEATFDYADPRQALVIGGTLLLGLLLARWVVRHPEPSLLTAVRRAHTGSVNDYASYAVMGVVVSVAVLVLT